jgi:hypothetical protein
MALEFKVDVSMSLNLIIQLTAVSSCFYPTCAKLRD